MKLTRRHLLGAILAAPFVAAAKAMGPLFPPQDDTRRLQAMIDSAAREGKPLIIPKGTYRLSKSLDLRGTVLIDGCTLIGGGVVFTKDCRDSGVTNCHITGAQVGLTHEPPDFQGIRLTDSN